MNAREELAETLRTHVCEEGIDLINEGPDWHIHDAAKYAQEVASVVIAAGYRKPRTITTAEELDALYEGSLILDSDPDVLVKRMGRWRSPDHPDNSFGPASVGFPVTVLHEPQP